MVVFGLCCSVKELVLRYYKCIYRRLNDGIGYREEKRSDRMLLSESISRRDQRLISSPTISLKTEAAEVVSLLQAFSISFHRAVMFRGCF
jgi:hypothetical protein